MLTGPGLVIAQMLGLVRPLETFLGPMLLSFLFTNYHSPSLTTSDVELCFKTPDITAWPSSDELDDKSPSCTSFPVVWVLQLPHSGDGLHRHLSSVAWTMVVGVGTVWGPSLSWALVLPASWMVVPLSDTMSGLLRMVLVILKSSSSPSSFPLSPVVASELLACHLGCT